MQLGWAEKASCPGRDLECLRDVPIQFMAGSATWSVTHWGRTFGQCRCAQCGRPVENGLPSLTRCDERVQTDPGRLMLVIRKMHRWQFMVSWP
jgi:hypothetical protein